MDSLWLDPEPNGWKVSVERALAEDAPYGDETSLCIPKTAKCRWEILAQQDGVVCGLGIAQYLLEHGESPHLKAHCLDGSHAQAGQLLIEGECNTRHALLVERPALNFLMRLSGIATLTHKYSKAVEGTSARVIDTRKTTPGLRNLEKYAVRCGGGKNHRFGLSDGILLKDNHIAASGSISKAVALAKASQGYLLKIEVECDTLDQVDEAINSKADVVLLDNMPPALMKRLVEKYKGLALFEASGGISLDSVREVAETGVDFISIGAITHSAPSFELHMEIGNAT